MEIFNFKKQPETDSQKFIRFTHQGGCVSGLTISSKLAIEAGLFDGDRVIMAYESESKKIALIKTAKNDFSGCAVKKVSKKSTSRTLRTHGAGDFFKYYKIPAVEIRMAGHVDEEDNGIYFYCDEDKANDFSPTKTTKKASIIIDADEWRKFADVVGCRKTSEEVEKLIIAFNKEHEESPNDVFMEAIEQFKDEGDV